jgi:hypothetical protein
MPVLLTIEDQRHITAAQGYVELGMFLDANAELEEIDSELRSAPEVLAVRLGIYTGLKKWELMQVVARSLVNHDPAEVQWSISLAYATRRAESIEDAKIILLEAVERQPWRNWSPKTWSSIPAVRKQFRQASGRVRSVNLDRCDLW